MVTIKEYVQNRKEELKKIFEQLPSKPHLVIVQVNQDEASNAYVRGKIKDCAFVGAKCTHKLLDVTTKEEELLSLIDKLNKDLTVNGIIVQLPLPIGIEEEKIKNAIDPSKDVDGFHPLSKLSPCTPKGIINYLVDMGYEFAGKNACVIGRSNIVGKPMAKLLLAKSMNVTVLHSKTKEEDLKFYTDHADLIIVAVGKKGIFKSTTLKENCIIMDVGINRMDGVLYGDVNEETKASFISPVPGGVGLLTRLCLLENLHLCFLMQKENK